MLFGTIVADWITCMTYDPLIIHKYGFKNRSKLKGYYLTFLIYYAAAAVMLLFNRWLATVLLHPHHPRRHSGRRLKHTAAQSRVPSGKIRVPQNRKEAPLSGANLPVV